MKNRSWRYWFNLMSFGLILLGGVIVVGFSVASSRSTEKYLHPQRKLSSDNKTPDDYGIDYEDIRLLTVDGIELAAWYTPPVNGALILVAHGHSDRRSLDQYVLYARNGYGVLAWDFRAHGESSGELSTLGYHEALDVEVALEYGLKQVSVEHIGAWGGSMGGAAVLELASRRFEIEAVVVDSTFPTLEDELRWIVSNNVFLPFIRFFAEKEAGVDLEMLRPVDRIGEISPRPVMIIQGEADDLIPADSAQRLYDASGDPRYLWTEAGVGHVGMYSVHPVRYEDRVIGFFDEYLVEGSK